MQLVLKTTTYMVAVAVGAAVGAVVAFYGTFYACVLIDWIRDADGGNSIMTVGWIFCLFTVPAGIYYGGYGGLILASHFADGWESTERARGLNTDEGPDW